MSHLSDHVTRHWIGVIVAWVALLIGLRLVAPRWDDVTHDGDMAYLPAEMPTLQAERLRAEAFPEQRAKSQIVVVLARSDRRLDDEDLDFAVAVSQRLRQMAEELGALEIWDPDDDVVGRKLVSRDRQAAIIVLQLSHEFTAVRNIEVLDQVRAAIADARRGSPSPAGLEIEITGSAAIGGDLLGAARESIRNTEVTTIALVLLILLAVYRAPLLILIPLATIAVSVSVAMNLVALLTTAHLLPGMEWWNFKIFTTTKIFVVVILFGAGTDFCLFLIARYKEELEHGRDPNRAPTTALASVTGALVGSALTTVLGLATMFFADFGKFRNSGPAIALCLAVTLAASLTLAPALLRGLGRGVLWPRSIFNGASQRPQRKRRRFSYFWEWLSQRIVARPGLILATTLLVMAPLAWQGWSVDVTYDLLNELEPDRPSRAGTRLLLQHYPAGEVGPVTVLAQRKGGQFDTLDGKSDIDDLSQDLSRQPGIIEVRSLSQPLGEPPVRSILSFSQIAESESTRTKNAFVSHAPGLEGEVTRLDLVLTVGPFSREAIQLLDEIESYLRGVASDKESPWHGTLFHVLGTTAATRDLRSVTESDRWLIQQLVVLAVLAVLIVLIRRPIVCIYLILSVLLSYYVTLGITEWFFAWSYGSTYHGLDWKVPIFLFVILVAVGEDYNIYLMTRVIEEQRTREPLEGLRVAVARTGGIITSCGVIMAGTFISMMTGTMRGVRELGFALSLGILLDTLIVRPVLVPAFLALLHRFSTAGRETRDSAMEQQAEVAIANHSNTLDGESTVR